MRYLRSKNNGAIFEWNQVLADNPACVEISEIEAFPERFIPEQVVEKVKRGRKPKIDLSTPEDDIPDPPHYTDPELAKDASKGLP